MDDLRERVEKRIAELKAARDEFVTTANQRMVAFDTVITELERLLSEADGEG